MYRNHSNHDRLRENTVVYDRVRWKYGRLRPFTVKIRSFTTVYGGNTAVYDRVR
jgi:hypothetical protein